MIYTIKWVMKNNYIEKHLNNNYELFLLLLLLN